MGDPAKIEFSGLRDGETLFEEVLNDAEQTKPTGILKSSLPLYMSIRMS